MRPHDGGLGEREAASAKMARELGARSGRPELDCLVEVAAAGEDPCLDDERVWIVRGVVDLVRGREPLLGFVGASLGLEGLGDQERLAGLVGHIAHLREHAVCVLASRSAAS